MSYGNSAFRNLGGVPTPTPAPAFDQDRFNTYMDGLGESQRAGLFSQFSNRGGSKKPVDSFIGNPTRAPMNNVAEANPGEASERRSDGGGGMNDPRTRRFAPADRGLGNIDDGPPAYDASAYNTFMGGLDDSQRNMLQEHAFYDRQQTMSDYQRAQRQQQNPQQGIMGMAPQRMQQHTPMMRHPMQMGGYGGRQQQQMGGGFGQQMGGFGGGGGGFGQQQQQMGGGFGGNSMQMLMGLLSQAFGGGGGFGRQQQGGLGGMMGGGFGQQQPQQQQGGFYGQQQPQQQMPQQQQQQMPQQQQQSFYGAQQPVQNNQQQAYSQPQQASPFGGAMRGYYA